MNGVFWTVRVPNDSVDVNLGFKEEPAHKKEEKKPEPKKDDKKPAPKKDDKNKS